MRIVTPCLIALFLVSCAEIGVLTHPAGSRTLPESEWGQFEKQRAFKTTTDLAFYSSTKTLFPVGEYQPLTASGKASPSMLLPRGSIIKVTKIIQHDDLGHDWKPRSTKLIYATVTAPQKKWHKMQVNIIADFEGELAANRSVVMPMP